MPNLQFLSVQLALIALASKSPQILACKSLEYAFYFIIQFTRRKNINVDKIVPYLFT